MPPGRSGVRAALPRDRSLRRLRLDGTTAEARNGATWIRDCLLDAPAMARALERLQMNCQLGIRHFSAIGISVPLDRVGTVETEISRIESERD